MLTKKEQRLRRARQTRIRIAQQSGAVSGIDGAYTPVVPGIAPGRRNGVLVRSASVDAVERTLRRAGQTG